MSAIEKADEQDAKMSAFCVFLEFGSTEEKLKAKEELAKFAFPTKSSDTSSNAGDVVDDESTTSLVELVV